MAMFSKVLWVLGVGMGATQPTDKLPAIIVSLPHSGGRNATLASLRLAGFSEAQFFDAVDYRDQGAMSHWLGAKTFDHVPCTDWRTYAYKKIAVWASFLSALDVLIALDRTALLLEDDVLLRPTPKGFRKSTDAVLRYMRTSSLAEHWDMVFLGSCGESLRAAGPCTKVKSRDLDDVFIARAFRPDCAHAILFSPVGARRVRSLLSSWGSFYWQRSLLITEPAKGCENDVRLETVQIAEGFQQHRWTGPSKFSDFSIIHTGKDSFVKEAIIRGLVNAYEVWPPSVAQLDHLQDPFFSYNGTLPESCANLHKAREPRARRHCYKRLGLPSQATSGAKPMAVECRTWHSEDLFKFQVHAPEGARGDAH